MAVILQVLPKFGIGGTEYETLDTVNFLAKNGHKCIIISAGGELQEKLNSDIIHIDRKTIKSKNLLHIWLNIDFISKIIKKYNVDIVHARSRAPAWSCYYAVKKFPKVKFVTSFHGLYGMKNVFKKFYNSGMVRSDKIIAVSDYCREYIAKYYPQVSDKIITIHSWVDEKKTEIDQEYLEEVKHNLHIDKDTKVVFLPGRLGKTKGHEFWIRSMNKVHEYGTVCLTMCGNESHMQEHLAKVAHNIGFRHRLEFLPYTDKISTLYYLADVVVCPSTKAESFGKTVVEACLMEKPVIATDLGSFKETIVNEKTGWLFEKNNMQQFAKQIENVIKMSNEEKKKITTEAKKYVLENFGSSKMLPKIMKVYEDMLK